MFGGDFPPVDSSLPRNGFRPGGRQPYFQKNEHSFVTTSYRYGNPKDYGAPLASISGNDGNTSSTVQGYRVGISSREKQTRPTTQRNVRIRNSTSYSSSVDKNRGNESMAMHHIIMNMQQLCMIFRAFSMLPPTPSVT